MDVILLLRIVLVVELAAVTIIILFIAIGAVSRRWQRSRWHEPTESARRTAAHLLQGDGVLREAAEALALLPRDLQIRVIWELASSVSGESHERLVQLAREVGLIRWAEEGIDSRRWWRRLQAVQLLSTLRTPSAATAELIDDPHPMVRARALEWAAATASAETVPLLVARFDDPSTLCRFTLQDSLERVGRMAVPALLTHLATSGDEVSAAALDSAASMPDPRFLPAALQHSTSADPALRAAATRLLAAIGGSAAEARLAQLLDDEAAEVRIAAAAAVGELAVWRHSADLGRLLGDAEWEVRSRAALALARLGPPGTLVLRAALSGEDPFAADMARHILDTRPVAKAAGGAR